MRLAGPLRRGGLGVRPPRRRRARAATRAARAREAIQRPHRGQRLPGLRALARAASRRERSRWSTGAARRDAPAGRARRPRRASARWSASGSRASRRATTDLLELAAAAGAEFELDVVRRAADLAEPELLAALEEAVAQRNDRGAALARGSPAASPTSSCAARSTTGSQRLRRAELHLRVGEALEAQRRGARGRALADLAHHFAAAAPLGGTERAVEYNLLAARAATARACLRRGRGAAAYRARARDRRPARARGGLPRARHAPAIAPARRPTRSRRSWRRPRSPASSATRELLARAAIGYEEACWRPGIADAGRGRAARGGADGARRRRLASCASACSPGSPARSTSRASASAARSSARARSSMARRAGRPHRAREGAGALLLVARDEPAGGDPRDADRGAGPRRGARRHRDPRRGDGLAGADLRRPRRPRVGAARGRARCARPPSRRAAVHASTSPSTTARRSRSATAGSRRPRRRRERSHEWSRLLTGRDASGTHGIQMFSIRREQGRLAELAPVVRILAGERRPRRAVAARAGRGARRARAWRTRPGASSTRLAAEGLEQFRESLWLASLTYLTDACAALGDEAMAAIVYPELEPLAGANVMIGHLVACYGAADRYLGMLAATLGEASAPRSTSSGRSSSTGGWARRPGSPTRAYEYARCCSGATAPRERARPRAARRGGRRSPSGSAWRRCSADPGARVRAAERRAARRPLAPRGADPAASSRAGPQQPRDRRRALDQRAHRRQPHPQHPAQDRAARTAPRPPPTPTGTGSPRLRRRWAVGSGDAALHDRAHLRRSARAHRRRRQADRGDQRRRGRPLALLVPQRRPPPHLLPLRGALARRDPRRRTSAPTSRPTRSSRSAPARRSSSGRLRDWATAQTAS